MNDGTEAGIQFERFQVQRILAAGGWQQDRHADLVPGEIMTFTVQSFTSPGQSYRVVLNENWSKQGEEFNGACGCVNFETRCFPNFRRNGGRVVDYVNGDHESRTVCKHLYLAKREFVRRVTCRLSLGAM